jgi:hypothetical protein
LPERRALRTSLSGGVCPPAPDAELTDESGRDSCACFPLVLHGCEGTGEGSGQEAIGIVDGESRIRLSFSVFPGATPSFDEVVIVGTPEVRARMYRCRHCGHGTVAMAVNLIPAVINARAGALLTINDIVPVSFKAGDLGQFVVWGA